MFWFPPGSVQWDQRQEEENPINGTAEEGCVVHWTCRCRLWLPYLQTPCGGWKTAWDLQRLASRWFQECWEVVNLKLLYGHTVIFISANSSQPKNLYYCYLQRIYGIFLLLLLEINKEKLLYFIFYAHLCSWKWDFYHEMDNYFKECIVVTVMRYV